MATLNYRTASIDFSNLTCQEARKKYIDGEFNTFEESTKLELFIKQCNAQTNNEKNPNEQKRVIANLSYQNGEQRIVYGLITLKEGMTIAAYTKFFLKIITGNAFTNDPITKLISETVGEYTIDAWLEGGINNDPLLFLYPMELPAKKFLNDVLDEVSKIDVTAISSEIYNITEDAINNSIQNPEQVIAPISQLQYKIVNNTIEMLSKSIDEAGKLIERNKSVVLPFTPVSFSQIDKVLAEPAKAPEIIGQALTEPIENTIKTLNDVVNDIKDNLPPINIPTPTGDIPIPWIPPIIIPIPLPPVDLNPFD